MPWKEMTPERQEKMRAYRREHYRRNSQVYKDRASERRQALREEMQTLKKAPCADCGQSYPYYVMDWDHRPDEVKLHEPKDLPNLGNRTTMLAEIAKCDLVCSNCHRERTYQRGLLK